MELGGNRFRSPRPAMLTKGTAALLEYLRDRISKWLYCYQKMIFKTLYLTVKWSKMKYNSKLFEKLNVIQNCLNKNKGWL